MIKNVEIKARSSAHDSVREILQGKGAVFKGTDHQIDTYFKVPQGRLKLREGNIENNLIHYHRSNQQGPKLSDVTLYKSNPDSSLKKILSDSIGILIVIDKIREIYFIDNVKFHIDQVKDLGSFIEIEAIDDNDGLSVEQLNAQCHEYMNILGVLVNDLVSISYSDLLILKEKE